MFDEEIAQLGAYEQEAQQAQQIANNYREHLGRLILMACHGVGVGDPILWNKRRVVLAEVGYGYAPRGPDGSVSIRLVFFAPNEGPRFPQERYIRCNPGALEQPASNLRRLPHG